MPILEKKTSCGSSRVVIKSKGSLQDELEVHQRGSGGEEILSGEKEVNPISSHKKSDTNSAGEDSSLQGDTEGDDSPSSKRTSRASSTPNVQQPWPGDEDNVDRSSDYPFPRSLAV